MKQRHVLSSCAHIVINNLKKKTILLIKKHFIDNNIKTILPNLKNEHKQILFV